MQKYSSYYVGLHYKPYSSIRDRFFRQVGGRRFDLRPTFKNIFKKKVLSKIRNIEGLPDVNELQTNLLSYSLNGKLICNYSFFTKFRTDSRFLKVTH